MKQKMLHYSKTRSLLAYKVLNLSKAASAHSLVLGPWRHTKRKEHMSCAQNQSCSGSTHCSKGCAVPHVSNAVCIWFSTDFWTSHIQKPRGAKFFSISHSVIQHDMRLQTTEVRLDSMPCVQVASQYLLSWWGLTAEYEVPQLVTYATLQTWVSRWEPETFPQLPLCFSRV